MNQRHVVVMLFAVAAVLLTATSSRAASLATETFTSSTGGWQDRDVDKLNVTNLTVGGNPGGCMSGTFPLVTVPSPPKVDAFMATGLLASANFVGNYTEVEAYLLGFDFRANDNLPGANGLRVKLISGANSILRRLDTLITATGVWYSIRVPLVDPQVGGWENDIGQFSAIMSNVTRLEIELIQEGTGQQTYLVDNVFLDRLPEALSVVSTTNGVDITWLNLRNGVNYHMDVASDLVQPDWSAVSNITAASSVWVANYSSTNTAILYRLIME